MMKLISIFVPIRKNSKRVKNKNIKQIKHHKLGLTENKISQIFELLKKIKKDKILKRYNYEIVISTDSPVIKDFLKKYPVVRVHERPKHLAKDDCLSELIAEVPKFCNGDLLLWTHVTSPMFKSEDYYSFLKNFLKINQKLTHDSSFTVDINKKYLLNKTGKWISHNHLKKKWPRTQDLRNIYTINSAAFISTRKNYLLHNDRIGNRPYFYVCKNNSGFDIDTYDNFNYYKNILI